MIACKFSTEDRVNRKRQAARIRQQRCRARKRAMAAAAVAASKDPDATPSQVIVDGNELKIKERKPQQNAKLAKGHHVPPYAAAQMLPSCAPNEPHTTVDGVPMSKRAAFHQALLGDHNRKFFAQVEAERKGGVDNKDDKVDRGRSAPMSHVVVTNNHASHKGSSVSTPTRTHSPMHPYYRHTYPTNAYYPYPPAYGPRPHGKYSAPTHHHPRSYPPHSPPPPPPMYRSAYDGRYHPIPPPPHALYHRHIPAMPPPQHSMMESSSALPTTVPAVVSQTVSDDDRSTPSQEFSPTNTTAATADEDASYHSMDQKEQEAVAAMLTLSSASLDGEEEKRKETTPPQQPLLISQ